MPARFVGAEALRTSVRMFECSVHQQSFSMKLITGTEESRKLDDDFVFSERTDGSHFLRGILARFDRGLHLARTRLGRRVRRRRRLLPVVERRGRGVLQDVCRGSALGELSPSEKGQKKEEGINAHSPGGETTVSAAQVSNPRS